MPTLTPRGFPFPIGTDRVADGDDAIRALAEAVDTKIAVTTMRAGSYTGTTDASGILNIPHGLGVVPAMAIATCSHRTDRIVGLFRTNFTTTTIQVAIRNAAGGGTVAAEAARVEWLAIV